MENADYKIEIMKKEYWFLFLISLVLTIYCLLKKDVINSNDIEKNDALENNSTFKIIRIDSIENVYLIYAERNDSIFKIMSKKEDVSNCQPLSEGEFYKLKIISWFLPEEFHVKMRVAGVKFENTLIEIEKDSVVCDLFTTENLEGLCYFPSSIEKDNIVDNE